MASARQNQQIEQEHLLLALLEQKEGLIPQLLPQGPDMHIHRAALTHIVRAPDVVEQLIPGERHTGMGQKQPQQLKFLICQAHPFTGRRNDVAVGIQRHIAVGKAPALPRRRTAAQHRLDAGDHLHHAKGLNKIVVRPQIKALDLVVFHSPGCGHDNGNIAGTRRLAQKAQQRNAVLSGQHHIQQHQLRQFRFQCGAKAAAVGKAAGLKACGIQGIHLDLADAAVILHTPDHVISSPL